MLLDQMITGKNLAEYSQLIPKNYHEGIASGKLHARAVYDNVIYSDVDKPRDKQLTGVCVTAVYGGWLELVWVFMPDADMQNPDADSTSAVEKANFIRHCITQERFFIEKRSASPAGSSAVGDEALDGAFIEIYEDEAWDDIEKVLELTGMEARKGKNNVYDFTLGDVTNSDMLKKSAARMECIPLARADRSMLDGLGAMMHLDERPIPMSEIIDWSRYLPDISYIALSRGKPCGVFLVSMKKDSLVAELGYTRSKAALPALLWNVLQASLKCFGPGQRVIVPVVISQTAALVERLVPGAVRKEMINGIMWF